MKYFYVTYETRDGEHEYKESGVLKANDYKLGVEKAQKAKPLYERYGWEEFCQQDEIIEITKAEYMVLKRFMLDVDYYFHENGNLIA